MFSLIKECRNANQTIVRNHFVLILIYNFSTFNSNQFLPNFAQRFTFWNNGKTTKKANNHLRCQHSTHRKALCVLSVANPSTIVRIRPTYGCFASRHAPFSFFQEFLRQRRVPLFVSSFQSCCNFIL